MSCKTILYVNNFELPDKNAAAHRVVSNAKLFRECGYKVVFVDTDRDQQVDLVLREECFGFERWSVKKSNKQLYSIDSIKFVANKIDNLVAIVVYNHPAIALWKLKKYCKKNNVKLIGDITEWYCAEGPNVIHRVIKFLDVYWRMNILLPQLDGLIVISKYLEEYYKERVNTILLPPLTDVKDKKWEIEATKVDGSKINILYAGSPGKNKDKLNIILKALIKSDYNKVTFRIIGITLKQYMDCYPEDENLLRILDKSVIFLGRKTHLDVIKEVKASDFVLFYRERNRVTMAGFPTKFAEAVTAGTPVLTNRSSDLEEYLIEGVNGFWIDDIEKDLKNILEKDIMKTRNLFCNINKELFYYRNYLNVTKLYFNLLNI